jgi:hypothetical protein
MAIFPQTVRTFPSTSAATYTANIGDFVLSTTGAGPVVVNLPAAASGQSLGPAGASVTVKKVDTGAGAITVKTTDGSTIDGISGTTGKVLAATQGAVAEFHWDGTNWWTA